MYHVFPNWWRVTASQKLNGMKISVFCVMNAIVSHSLPRMCVCVSNMSIYCIKYSEPSKCECIVRCAGLGRSVSTQYTIHYTVQKLITILLSSYVRCIFSCMYVNWLKLHVWNEHVWCSDHKMHSKYIIMTHSIIMISTLTHTLNAIHTFKVVICWQSPKINLYNIFGDKILCLHTWKLENANFASTWSYKIE